MPEKNIFKQYSFLLHFMRFSTCDFISDRSIASYQEIFMSIPVEDKLAISAVEYYYSLVLPLC